MINYTESIEILDWRYSAAVVGLIRYLNHYQLDYNKQEIESEEEYDILRFYAEDITEERYLQFVEYTYQDEFLHKKAEQMLCKEEYSEEEIKLINGFLTGNTILKKYFSKSKFDGTNKEDILNTMNENRLTIVKESYRNKKNLYANFANSNRLFGEKDAFCRLNGYCIDAGKKGKSTGFNFNQSAFLGQDTKYFDFIPFAFSIGRESFFINNNSSIVSLVRTNDMLKDSVNKVKDDPKYNNDVRRILFKNIIEAADFIDYDVEVIKKDQENGYFESVFLRTQSIKVFRSIKDYKAFCFSYKISDDYYLNVQRKVTDAIINLVLVDNLIEFFLQKVVADKRSYEYLINQLISINCTMKEGVKVKGYMGNAYACGKEVAKKLEQNKLDSYRTKLTSAIVFKDYTRVCDILLQLSNYSKTSMDFVYNLYEDFEQNKELAYTFINAMTKATIKGEKENNMEVEQ